VNAILDWPMATRAGFTAFQDPKVNQLVSVSSLVDAVMLMSSSKKSLTHGGNTCRHLNLPKYWAQITNLGFRLMESKHLKKLRMPPLALHTPLINYSTATHPINTTVTNHGMTSSPVNSGGKMVFDQSRVKMMIMSS